LFSVTWYVDASQQIKTRHRAKQFILDFSFFFVGQKTTKNKENCQ
jgi:hypothetical protein